MTPPAATILAYAAARRNAAFLQVASVLVAVAEVAVPAIAYVVGLGMEYVITRPQLKFSMLTLVYHACDVLQISPAVIVCGLALTGAGLTAAVCTRQRQVTRISVVLLATHAAGLLCGVGALLA